MNVRDAILADVAAARACRFRSPHKGDCTHTKARTRLALLGFSLGEGGWATAVAVAEMQCSKQMATGRVVTTCREHDPNDQLLGAGLRSGWCQSRKLHAQLAAKLEAMSDAKDKV